MKFIHLLAAFGSLAIAQRPTGTRTQDSPLGIAVETHSASSYGPRPPVRPGVLPGPPPARPGPPPGPLGPLPLPPGILPGRPGPLPGPSSNVTANGTLSTSEDARRNPWAFDSPEHRGIWFPGYTINTDYNEKWPFTGRTVRAIWTITNTTYAPDGGDKQIMMLVNEQYPGPLLEGNWGDFFEVTVINKLPNNGTGIHWHGFRQLNNNDADGPGGVTECPIPPGGQKTYRFQATGYGPIIVHCPASANYDIDLGNVLLNEWYEQTSLEKDWSAHRTGPPQGSNYLVNGRNIKPDGSAGQRTQFRFTPGKKHFMRFANVGLDQLFKVKIDGHSLLVIANDHVPVVPYWTKELWIGIGQRYDVVVTADQAMAKYFLRTIPAPACSFNKNNGLGSANAIISCNGAGSALPTTTNILVDPQCFDEPIANLVPIVTVPVDGSTFAAQFATLPVNLRQATLATGDNVFLWYINGISQNVDWSHPTISAVALNRTVANASALLPTEWHTITLPALIVWTFWVIQNQFFVPHPMHLHGHDFALLGQGSGTFDPVLHLAQLNFKNPTRRDVAMLASAGWTVIAFKTDNAGAWLMHCHIAWHVGEGLSLEFLELPKEMPWLYGGRVGKGTEFERNCKAWDRYVQTAEYPKSDSGLRRRGVEEVREM